MDIVKRLAPTTIVLAMVVWCCRSYVGGQDRFVLDGQDRLPCLTPKMLSPAVEPVSLRDPFRPKTLAVVESPVSTQPAEPEDPMTTVEPPSPVVDVARVLGALKLNGTFLQGERRLALIDNHFVEEGVPVKFAKLLSEPSVVTQIQKDRVVIQHEGQIVELLYAQQPGRP